MIIQQVPIVFQYQVPALTELFHLSQKAKTELKNHGKLDSLIASAVSRLENNVAVLLLIALMPPTQKLRSVAETAFENLQNLQNEGFFPTL
ncbi:hypothetical protein L5515_018695 [Caenorhabditis briggsae]|uniref:Uncharacterized protein n=1 Tax=Caenorhabditis briggsae TaxID=6238 RepID=A0AAE9FCY1_CAEBR|nr:hypothetical protein L5515_018695 [Caenorhabditis briggsae]